ncbi:MAG: amino acid-binding protein [Deltaproteobacteria bacterium]|nr:amino acid-binding protein [Deltaproteobacteria bacterium]MBW1960700.1 amino acid-binding protein [Deltaproteobacteria bacterium]MBW1993583.1 amino acid-binding protein [Deltaproteobacteria bacterium]MBW2151965.1 amino acid-binding protein [Deltaproteobacteria bacterium]
MKLKQITIAIENSPGRLYEVTNALGEAGINLRAASLVDTGAFGQLRLLVSDLAKTRRILMKMQMPAKVDEVVAVEIEDKPGSLARMLKPLIDANIQVTYTYAFVGFQPGSAIMIFRFSDNDKAIKVLQENGMKLLDSKDFGILETNNN